MKSVSFSSRIGAAFVSTVLAFSAALSAAKADSTAWKINPDTSTIKFSVKNMGLNATGKFTKIEGDVEYDSRNMSHSKVNATIDITSLQTGITLKDKHLQSVEFFHSAKFPQAEFHSMKVEPDSDGDFTITGKLTLHGQTETVTLYATPLKMSTDENGVKHLSTTAQGTVQRKKFHVGGITSAASVANDVSLDLTMDLTSAQ